MLVASSARNDFGKLTRLHVLCSRFSDPAKKRAALRRRVHGQLKISWPA
jgi:hypothetical protein